MKTQHECRKCKRCTKSYESVRVLNLDTNRRCWICTSCSRFDVDGQFEWESPEYLELKEQNALKQKSIPKFRRGLKAEVINEEEDCTKGHKMVAYRGILVCKCSDLDKLDLELDNNYEDNTDERVEDRSCK